MLRAAFFKVEGHSEVRLPFGANVQSHGNLSCSTSCSAILLPFTSDIFSLAVEHPTAVPGLTMTIEVLDMALTLLYHSSRACEDIDCMA